MTVTENEHDAVLFDVSVAVHVTDVVPTGNVDPDAGTQRTLTAEHESEAVGLKETGAEQVPGAVPTVIFGGQLIVGALTS